MFVFKLLLFLFLIFGTPIVLSFLIYKFIKKKGYNSKFQIVSIIPVTILVYFVYTALYPSVEFYRDDFKEVTGIDLPERVNFKYKTATYPDHFGDYVSVSIIEVDKDFYDNLDNELLYKKFKNEDDKVHNTELDKAMRILKQENLNIIDEYSLTKDSKSFYVGFLSDKKSILVQRLSW